MIFAIYLKHKISRCILSTSSFSIKVYLKLVSSPAVRLSDMSKPDQWLSLLSQVDSIAQLVEHFLLTNNSAVLLKKNVCKKIHQVILTSCPQGHFVPPLEQESYPSHQTYYLLICQCYPWGENHSSRHRSLMLESNGKCF